MNNKTNTITKQLEKINKSLIIHNQIMTVLLKFALDSSSYKSKTTDEIKATASMTNEILNSIHESSQ